MTQVSVLEIYLEKVRDLLDARHGTAAEPKLEVRQDTEGKHDVPGLTSKEVRATCSTWSSVYSSTLA
jgi:hypothetical protein